MCLLVQVLTSDYKKDLLRWIDEENLIALFGGKSEGALDGTDAGPWIDPDIRQRLHVDETALRKFGWCSNPHSACEFSNGSAASTAVSAACAATGVPASAVIKSSSVGIRFRTSDSGAEGDDGFYDACSEAGSFSSNSLKSVSGSPFAAYANGKGDMANGTVYATVAEADSPVQSFQDEDRHAPLRPILSSSPNRLSQPHPSNSSLPSLTSSASGRPLAERVRRLESLVQEQQARLRTPLIPASSAAISAAGDADSAHSGEPMLGTAKSWAPEGSLMWRVDLLEAGMELLLAAQEMSWKGPATGDKSRNCCCTIM